MAEKNLVEETFIQIQNLENVINENAKEILASTMKGEISELVKESMKEETDEQVEDIDMIDVEDEDDDSEITGDELSIDDMGDMEDMGGDTDMDDMDDMEDMGDMIGGDLEDVDVDFDDETIDLTDASDEEVLKVFKAMSADDEITVTQDGDYIHLQDDSEDVEYLIQTESEDELEESWLEEELDEVEEKPSKKQDKKSDARFVPKSKMMEEMDEEMDITVADDSEELVYEIEMDEEMDEEMESDTYENVDMMESKMVSKPKVGKGAKTGSASKFSYKKSTGGFKETMKKANPTKGTGKAKFEFKENESIMDMPSRTPKLSKEEAKEAARTYGTGWRKGALPKGARAGQEAARLQTESTEIEMLKAKNEEYRKALNMFRDKLNEVATFNSNLAYATRLFTEHSTSKQEKINILRRFDTVETIKESKALYKTIKDELSGSDVRKPVTESIDRIIESDQKSGSAINLIESKTYENPQFLRMKDIMSKITK
jgi:hypothetical protein